MELNFENDGVVAVVSIAGRLDTFTAQDAEQKILEKFGECAAYIFDLQKLEYISSSGLRLFLKLAREARAKNVRLVLCGLNDSVFEVFEISGFSTLLEIVSSRDEARAVLA